MTLHPPPSTGPTARAIAGAAGAPLSKEQKRNLILAANAAYAMQMEHGLWAGTYDDFRHGAAFDACGVSSFRAMQQRHYLPTLLHYRALAGADVQRQRVALATDDTRRALAKLRQECEEAADCFGGPDESWHYAESLARRIHKTPLASANPKQVWQVLFTLRNRAASIRRKGDRETVRQSDGKTVGRLDGKTVGRSDCLTVGPSDSPTASHKPPSRPNWAGAFPAAPTPAPAPQTPTAGFRGRSTLLLFPSVPSSPSALSVSALSAVQEAP